MRLLGLIAVLGLLAPCFAEEELPANPMADSIEIEPPLLIPNPGTVDHPAEADNADDDAPAVAPHDLPQLEMLLERAKKNATEAQRLFKNGVLAKVEVEERALRVVRLECDVAQARFARANEAAAEQERRFEAGEIAKSELDATAAALAQAGAAAEAAAANRQHAEVEAAMANLKRQQQLLAAGIARKSEVKRAEERLAAVKGEKN